MFGHLRSKEVELKQLAEDRRRLIEGRAPTLYGWLSMEGLPIRRSPDDMAPRVFGRVPSIRLTGPREAVKVTKAPPLTVILSLTLRLLVKNPLVVG